jgi:hypothetical protein
MGGQAKHWGAVLGYANEPRYAETKEIHTGVDDANLVILRPNHCGDTRVTQNKGRPNSEHTSALAQSKKYRTEGKAGEQVGVDYSSEAQLGPV